MKELMIFVERIVRPVRALQARKLRMRRELLDHLMAALEQERERCPDEATAIEQARNRIGDPAQLTRQLQRTVPMWERVLLARAPLSASAERFEQRSAEMMYGIRGTMTMGHISILAGVGGLVAGIPWYLSHYVHDALGGWQGLTHLGPQPAHITTFYLGLLVGVNVLVLASCRFVFAAADPGDRLELHGKLRRAGAVLGLQIAVTFFAAWASANRPATISEVAGCSAMTLALLLLSALIARRISILRRTYDEWLTLDIAK